MPTIYPLDIELGCILQCLFSVLKAAPVQGYVSSVGRYSQHGLGRVVDGRVDALSLEGIYVYGRSGDEGRGYRHAEEDAQHEFPVIRDAPEYVG